MFMVTILIFQGSEVIYKLRSLSIVLNINNYTNRIWREYFMSKTFKLIAVLFVFVMCMSIEVSGDIPLRVVVNGQKINFPDAQPFIDTNGRTQVPVRFVSEL